MQTSALPILMSDVLPPKPRALTPKQVAACVDGLTERVARVLMARQVIPSYAVGRRDYRTLDTWLEAWKRGPHDLTALIASVGVDQSEQQTARTRPKHYSQFAPRTATRTKSR